MSADFKEYQQKWLKVKSMISKVTVTKCYRGKIPPDPPNINFLVAKGGKVPV